MSDSPQRTRLSAREPHSRAEPRLTTVTPLGWVLIVGLVVTAIPGWFLGWLEFRALSAMCATALVIAMLAILGRREHEVVFHLERPRVQVGDTAAGAVLVRAAGDRATGSVALEFPVSGEVANFRVPPLAVGQVHEEPFTIPASRRGVIEMGPVRSVQTDPLVLVSRQKLLSDACELFVHPRILPLEAGAVGFLRDVEGVATQNLSSSDVSFHALREYVPGDDRRSVHWRTTARTGQLMVRQFEETMRAHLLIPLSTDNSDYESEEDFELAVSVAGSLGVSALRDDRQVTVCTSTEQLFFPGPIGLLDRLSGVELGDEGRDLRSLAITYGSNPGVSVAAFVTGSTAPATLRAAQLALPPGIFPFAVRCGPTAELARRRVGDLIILDLTSLDDLRPAVRSLV